MRTCDCGTCVGCVRRARWTARAEAAKAQPKPKPSRPALPAIACRTCGEPFPPKSKAHVYCSDDCREYVRHRRPRDTEGRRYDREHTAVRARWRPLVDAGQAYCAEIECLEDDRWIPPGTPWDLAHDHQNGGYLGPAHPRCNRTEGARRGGIAAKTNRQATSF